MFTIAWAISTASGEGEKLILAAGLLYICIGLLNIE